MLLAKSGQDEEALSLATPEPSILVDLVKGSVSRRTDRWVEDFIAKPLIMVIGIYVVAVVLAAVMEIEWNLFPPIFTAVGGVPALGAYFKKKLDED